MFSLFKRIEWRVFKEVKKIRLTNKKPTIIASNCNGGIIYHDLSLEFNSPTIDLSIDTDDFIKMVKNLRFYMSQDIVEVKDDRYSFPCGMLKDIKIRFNHYDTFENAVAKWEERKKRIDWNNIYIMAIDGDNATYNSLKEFESIPYKNKVIFTHLHYPEFKSSYYIKGFEDRDEVGVLIYFKKSLLIRRYLDSFDYVSFLNKNKDIL